MLKSAALFAGIGGFCLGFESAGIRTSWAVELDEAACATYGTNLPDVRLLNASVTDLDIRKLDLEPVDVLHAGFPCQSFSQAGARKGFEDPRGRLFFEIPRIIKSFGDKKPKVLVLENAPFLRYGDGGAWFLELQNAIKKAGYWFRPDTNCRELNSFELTTVPQQRIRLFMVAFSMEHFRNGRFDFPAEQVSEPKNLSAFIDFENEVDQSYYLNEENRFYKLIKKQVAADTKRIYQLRKYEVRAKPEGVCPTLTANMGLGGHNVPFIMTQKGLRKLTEDECLRLQGFPKHFKFPSEVSRSKRYTQVGNSVTVPVAGLLATSVRKKLHDRVYG